MLEAVLRPNKSPESVKEEDSTKNDADGKLSCFVDENGKNHCVNRLLEETKKIIKRQCWEDEYGRDHCNTVARCYTDSYGAQHCVY